MKILIVYYQSFLIKDLEECLTRLGHTYKCIEANVIVEQSDDDFCALFDIEMESGHYDCVFTFQTAWSNIIYLTSPLYMTAQCIAYLQSLFIINVIIVLYLMNNCVNS